MRNTAHLTGGKPIAVYQSVSQILALLILKSLGAILFFSNTGMSKNICYHIYFYIKTSEQPRLRTGPILILKIFSTI
jgi:hypothetical protein